MLRSPALGGLELRRVGGEARLVGRFPYEWPTEIAAGHFEQFGPRAFRSRLEDEGADVHLLSQHDFGRPVAARLAGSLELREDETGLEFEARISPAVADTSHGRDLLALVHEGLTVGLSPGFRVPPDGAAVERRADGSVVRTIRAADLYEISVVTRAAYSVAKVEARSWEVPAAPRRHAAER